MDVAGTELSSEDGGCGIPSGFRFSSADPESIRVESLGASSGVPAIEADAGIIISSCDT